MLCPVHIMSTHVLSFGVINTGLYTRFRLFSAGTFRSPISKKKTGGSFGKSWTPMSFETVGNLLMKNTLMVIKILVI